MVVMCRTVRGSPPCRYGATIAAAARVAPAAKKEAAAGPLRDTQGIPYS
jgi:hypothetical protein